jgi:rSAM/selenodomain-associated transferase 2
VYDVTPVLVKCEKTLESHPVISTIIPTLNAEATLEKTLLSLNSSPLIAEIIVSDGASTDRTRNLAENVGAKFCFAEQGRGQQLAAGAAQAQHNWLLFLHADTVLEPGWEEEAEDFIKHYPSQSAAVFRFALNDSRFCARILERLVRLRGFLFALPYGDQGLLISKKFYNDLGGFRAIPLMEDVDIIRRIGRHRLVRFKSKAITSAERYQRHGYIFRSLKNLCCLMMFFCGVSPQTLEKFYR